MVFVFDLEHCHTQLMNSTRVNKSINATVNIFIDRNKSQNEDVNSSIYALIQLPGHSPKTVVFGLCCLMTPGLSKDIQCHVWPHFFWTCNSPDQTSGHTQSRLSAWWLHMVTSIFLGGLHSYVWVNILTLSPLRGQNCSTRVVQGINPLLHLGAALLGTTHSTPESTFIRVQNDILRQLYTKRESY